MGKDVYPLLTIMSECKFDAPLLLSVFLVLFNHTGPFLEKRLELKKFRLLLWREEPPVREGGHVKIVAYLNNFFVR